MISAKEFRELEPARPGDKTTPANSIAMVRIDDHSRFVTNRICRTADNKILISSSVTGKMNLSVHTLRFDP